jgi:hypothetical protein
MDITKMLAELRAERDVSLRDGENAGQTNQVDGRVETEE